jgi:hypothetical protein
LIFDAQLSFLGMVLTEANTFLTNTVATLPVAGNLVLPTIIDGDTGITTCEAFASDLDITLNIPPAYQDPSQGVPNADIVIFVTTGLLQGRVRAFAQVRLSRAVCV